MSVPLVVLRLNSIFSLVVVCKVIGHPTVKCFKTDRAVVPPAPLVTPTGRGGRELVPCPTGSTNPVGGSWSPAPSFSNSPTLIEIRNHHIS